MLFYPQLSTGSVAMFPLTRRNARRTIINALADGSSIRMPDSGASLIQWQLNYFHLTQAEISSIQQLFDSSAGQLQTFTFVDPTDNLLQWSEDPTQKVWKSDSMLQTTGGMQDPLGGVGAIQLVNAAQNSQQVVQALPIAGSHQYCFSAYIKSDQGGLVNLVASNGAEQAHVSCRASGTWIRFVNAFRFSSQTSSISVGVALPEASEATVFGVQLESQPGPGAYKKTLDKAGVYSSSRFADDVFTAVATGVNQYSCKVSIISRVAG